MKRVFVAALGRRDPCHCRGQSSATQGIDRASRELLMKVTAQNPGPEWGPFVEKLRVEHEFVQGPVVQALFVLWTKHPELWGPEQGRHHKVWLIHDASAELKQRATFTKQFIENMHASYCNEALPNDCVEDIEIKYLRPHLYGSHIDVFEAIRRKVNAHKQHTQGEIAFDVLVSSGTPALGVALMLATYELLPNPKVWQAIEPWAREPGETLSTNANDYLQECYFDGQLRRIRLYGEQETGLERELRDRIDVLVARNSELEQELASSTDESLPMRQVLTKFQREQLTTESFIRAWNEVKAEAAKSGAKFVQNKVAKRLGISQARVSQLKKDPCIKPRLN